MSCITENRGFQSTCLDVWVLETAYYAYRQQHGTDSHRGLIMFSSSKIFTIYIKKL